MNPIKLPVRMEAEMDDESSGVVFWILVGADGTHHVADDGPVIEQIADALNGCRAVRIAALREALACFSLIEDWGRGYHKLEKLIAAEEAKS